MTDTIKEVFIGNKMPFLHGYTFSGNPLCCRVANEVLTIILEGNLVEQVAKKGDYFFAQAKKLFKYNILGDVRGKGLLMGIELVKDARTKEPFDPALNAIGHFFEFCMEKGIIIYPCSRATKSSKGDYFLVCPPFTISYEEIDHIINGLDEALGEFERKTAK